MTRSGNFHFTIFLLVFFTIFITTNGICNGDQIHYIKHRYSGLTLDSTDTSYIKIQIFDGSVTQQWRFACGPNGPGLFYIVHPVTQNVLDFVRDSTPQYIHLNPQDGSLYQLWYLNSDGRISNAGIKNETLDIELGLFNPGTKLHLNIENLTPAQYFFIEEKV